MKEYIRIGLIVMFGYLAIIFGGYAVFESYLVYTNVVQLTVFIIVAIVSLLSCFYNIKKLYNHE